MRTNPSLVSVCLAAIFLMLLGMTAWAEQIPNSEGCGNCHKDNFESWHESGHANSIASDEFRSCLKSYLSVKNTSNGAYCLDCHAPGATLEGDAFAATKEILKGRTYREGVTCLTCHRVESVEMGKPIYDSGDIRGYHSVKDLKSINKEALCTTCHGTYQSDHEANANTDPGMLQTLINNLGSFVGANNHTLTDHGFSEVSVTSKSHWACQSQSGRASILAEGTPH